MQTKLTLRLDEDLINQGKLYAQRKGVSLSKLVGEYFKLLTKEKVGPQKIDAPVTDSLRGLLRGANVKEDDYKQYLEKKYL